MSSSVRCMRDVQTTAVAGKYSLQVTLGFEGSTADVARVVWTPAPCNSTVRVSHQIASGLKACQHDVV